MGQQVSDLATDDNCVGAYKYNPCWFFGAPLNTIFCCGRPAWNDGSRKFPIPHYQGGNFLRMSCSWPVFDDGVPLKVKDYPEWAKGTSLRNDFEQAIRGERMKEVLLAADRDPSGAMFVPKLAPHLNKNFCPEINESLLKQHGFRCEAMFWHSYLMGQSQQHPGEHFALAIFKIDPTDSVVVGDDAPFLEDQVGFSGFRAPKEEGNL